MFNLGETCMKKSLIALAALAAAGVASAQSSVTLFGIVDASISHYKTSGGQKRTALANSGYNSSRLGFRGTEDLGGGMSASFWLEGALSNDDGTPAGFMFQRRSTVSLAGGWGEVRLGRDYTPTFYNDSVFDPFGTNGVGTNVINKARNTVTATPFAAGAAANNNTVTRSSNMVSYFLPSNLGGFYGQVSYAFHEQAQPSGAAGDNGRYVGTRFGYANGPINVALAAGKRTGTDPTLAASPDVKTVNLGAQYDFGAAKLLGEVSREKYDIGGAETTAKGWMIGTLVPVGAGEIRASYGRVKVDAGADPRADQLALGYVHNLSKRTALYATVARIKNKNGAMLSINQSQVAGIANASSSGYDLGIRHSF
jgi:predicted porin